MNSSELLRQAPAAAQFQPGAPKDERSSPPAELKANILLVDDRPDKLLALGTILAPLGQNLVKANSGKEALRQLLKQDFAVILLDVVMPEMDGFETAAFIRQRRRSERTPIIFVTSLDSAEKHIASGYSLGAVDYLLAPIVPEILRAKVSVFVELYKQTAEIRRLNRELEGRVTALTKLNHELEQRTAKLRETFQELEGFSYSITHDMRAPLRAMHNFAALLEEECSGGAGPQSMELLQHIKQAARRMDRLILDALNYSKILSEQLPLRPVEAGKLLREVIATYPNLQAPQVDITIEFEELTVLGNEAGLTQCFSNLLGNAVKFVAPGVAPRVRVWAEKVQSPRSTVHSPQSTVHDIQHPASSIQHPVSSIRIWIEDNGIGIPRQAHEKIFVMFQRLHREDEYPGTGIGLAIVAKAMQRMGGRVGVESAVGKGSRFWLELPAAALPVE